MSRIHEALRYLRRDSSKRAFDSLGQTQRRSPLKPFERPLGSFSAQMQALYGAIRPLLDEKTEGAVIHFVSATPGEGVSTVAREFAFLASTTAHRRTLLVDGDVIRLDTASRFGCPTERGLADYVRDGQPYDDALRSAPGAALSVGILAGAGSGARLDVASVEDAYADFRKRYELTVIDCPSISSGRYFELLPEAADGIAMVVEAERTRPAVAVHAKGMVQAAGGNFVGAVLNKRRRYIPNFIYRLL